MIKNNLILSNNQLTRSSIGLRVEMGNKLSKLTIEIELNLIKFVILNCSIN